MIKTFGKLIPSCNGKLKRVQNLFGRFNANGINTDPLVQRQVFLLSTSCVQYKKDSETSFIVTMADKPKFVCDYAKRGTAGCKKCKTKIDKGLLRIGKLVPNPFGDEGSDMKQWFHPKCIFETFQRARATTKVIEECDDIDGISVLTPEDTDLINSLIRSFKDGLSPAKKKAMAAAKKAPVKQENNSGKILPESYDQSLTSSASGTATVVKGDMSKDNAFREFRRICGEVAEVSGYIEKTKIIRKFIFKDGFQGDTYLFLKLLLPGVVKRVYNIQDKQLVKCFSVIFGTNLEEMIEDLEKGDAAETVATFFAESKRLAPQKKSTLSIQEVDMLLESLSQVTKNDDQIERLTNMAQQSTVNDLKMMVRLIKHDLRINAGAKAILDSLGENTYNAFQASRNLKSVVERALKASNEKHPGGMTAQASLMTPVLPMLAEACKSVDSAMSKCPNGMYAEIKYDGERVQLHKNGDTFHYFSRTLKPVLPHKVKHFKDHIPLAFPHGNNMILDAEVLLLDIASQKPLPFGTLGVHKKGEFKDASVCLFIFDCLHFNGVNLMDKPLKERREFLKKNMKVVPNHVMFSEQHVIDKPQQLKELLMRVFREGLEGLVLKDVCSTYNPGKRHWLKVKKDYLAEGAMADTADLVVLGAFFGTGNKGGMMSVYLMGVFNPATNKWCTVTKCGNGHDDETLERLQTEIKMTKISKDVSKVPSWLDVKKNLVPDFVVADPKRAPVWEITGAEFSKSEAHTADGISIRFPRVTRIRRDKDWKTATDLPRLKILYEESKQFSDLPDALGASKFKGKATTSKNNNAMETESSVDNVRSVKPDVKNISPAKVKAIKREVPTPTKPDVKNISPVKVKAIKREASTPTKEQPSPKRKMLANIFQGMKFFIPEDGVDDCNRLRRYIIAFNGEVLKDHEESFATHIVLSKSSEKECRVDGGTTFVSQDWIWDCVRHKKVVAIK